MSTRDLKQATHILAGFGGIGVPHSQQATWPVSTGPTGKVCMIRLFLKMKNVQGISFITF